MKFTARPLSLLIALALCSFALGALDTTSSAVAPGALSKVQAFPSSAGDPSVPSASMVIFPVAEETTASTF